VEPQIGFCTTPDSARIAYATLGQGTPIVVSPSYWAVITSYKTVPELRHFWDSLARYHTIIFYDLRGAGLSDRNRTVFTLESDLRDLETLVDHLKLDHIILYGASSIGPIDIAYAAKYPERVTHLILYGTYANRRDLPEELKAAIVSLLRQPDNWAGRRTVASLAASQAQIDMLELIAAGMKDMATPEVFAHLVDMIYRLDVAHLCPLVKTPTLVMHRKGDPLVDFKQGLELASLIPNARFVPLEGNMHFAFLEDTESVLHNIFEFLGDPVPEKSANDTGKVASLSLMAEPKTKQKKENWLRMDNPLVFVIFAILASVIAGAILTLFKC